MQPSEKAYLNTAREFGQLQSYCGRLYNALEEAQRKLMWLEEKLQEQGVWLSLVGEMERDLGE